MCLGHHRDRNEHIIGTEAGVARAFSIRRLPEDRRWHEPWRQECTFDMMIGNQPILKKFPCWNCMCENMAGTRFCFSCERPTFEGGVVMSDQILPLRTDEWDLE